MILLQLVLKSAGASKGLELSAVDLADVVGVSALPPSFLTLLLALLLESCRWPGLEVPLMFCAYVAACPLSSSASTDISSS
jgi:hypothetical protein